MSEAMRLSNLKQTMLQMGLILIALEIIAIGIQLFFAPHEVAAGGATGVGILLEELMGWRISTVVLVINIGMLILAYFLLDKKTTLRILFGSFMLPVCLAITRRRWWLKINCWRLLSGVWYMLPESPCYIELMHLVAGQPCHH